MAFLAKSASVILITSLFFLFVVQLQHSDCNMASGCFYVQAAPREMYNRKILSGVEGNNKVVFKNGKGTSVGDSWELRQAPLGPDPLHHHGGSPKKPKTP